METLIKCDICKGTGKQTISVLVYGSKDKPESYKSDCIGCNGEGKVNEEEAAIIEYEKNMWCKCGKGFDNPIFYKDGKHPVIHKHHYRCRSCKKVIQIG